MIKKVLKFALILDYKPNKYLLSSDAYDRYYASILSSIFGFVQLMTIINSMFAVVLATLTDGNGTYIVNSIILYVVMQFLIRIFGFGLVD